MHLKLAARLSTNQIECAHVRRAKREKDLIISKMRKNYVHKFRNRFLCCYFKVDTFAVSKHCAQRVSARKSRSK